MNKKTESHAEGVPLLQLENLQSSPSDTEQERTFPLVLNRGKFLAVISSCVYDLIDLMELLNGTRESNSWRIMFEGKECSVKELKQFHMSYVVRRNTLYPQFTIAQNMFQQQSYSREKVEQLAVQQLKELNLDINLEKSVEDLTDGERKVIEILCAYNCGTDIMVLYDTVNYVNKRFAPRMQDLFSKICESGKSILYLTTNLEDALVFSDSIYLLDGERIEARYETAVLRKNPHKLVHLMSGLENGCWDNEEGNLALESIIEARDTLISNHELKGTLKQLAANLSHVMNAMRCIIYVNDPYGRSILVSVSSDDRNFENARLRPVCLQEFNKELKLIVREKSPEKFQEYFQQEPNCNAFLVMPVVVKSRGMGYVQLDYRDEPVLGKEAKLYLETFNREIVLAIETSRLLGRSMLLQETHHRIKNNLQLIVNLLYMQRGALNPKQRKELAPILNDIICRIKSIALVHEMLTVEEQQNSIVNLKEIIARILQFYAMWEVELDLDAETIMIPYNKATSIALVVNELINNAFKHAFTEGMKDKRLSIRCKQQGENVCLKIKDNGVGMDSLRDIQKEYSLGMQIIEVITKEFEGAVHYTSESGTQVEVVFPLNKFFEV